jgi:hypothetical protein
MSRIKEPRVQAQIAERIFLVRDQSVILDSDLALLYGVETKKLKQVVNRNRERFPPDFMIVLTKKSMMRCDQISTACV